MKPGQPTSTLTGSARAPHHLGDLLGVLTRRVEHVGARFRIGREAAQRLGNPPAWRRIASLRAVNSTLSPLASIAARAARIRSTASLRP